MRDVDLATLSGDGSSGGGGGALSWTKCSDNSGGGTEFRFDLDGVSLTVRESWVCEGVPG